MPGHAYILTNGTLDSELTVSATRVKVSSIFISNQNTTSAAVVPVADNDGTTLFYIVIGPVDSKLLTYAEVCDFTNGLAFGSLPTDGDLVSVTVSHSRSL